MDMEKTNAQTPKTASGVPNVGLFVAFNLPVHRSKYRAGVCEAKERALADAKLYEAQLDETRSEIADLMAQARAQEGILGLLRDQILPKIRQTLENAAGEYSKGTVDFAALISVSREVLQVRLQVAQVEAELGKALATLERAVGGRINDHPPAATPEAEEATALPEPPPSAATGPFLPTPPAGPGADRAASPDPR